MTEHTAENDAHPWCEPGTYPASLDETWTCPECGKNYRAFDVHAESRDQITRHVPPGTLGWTTAPIPPAKPEHWEIPPNVNGQGLCATCRVPHPCPATEGDV